jgi:hypothetical protein
MSHKWYLGLRAGAPRTIFQAERDPTHDTHGTVYDAVIGPFVTKRGAIFMRDYGAGNPHCRCVAEAERLARRHAGEPSTPPVLVDRETAYGRTVALDRPDQVLLSPPASCPTDDHAPTVDAIVADVVRLDAERLGRRPAWADDAPAVAALTHWIAHCQAAVPSLPPRGSRAFYRHLRRGILATTRLPFLSIHPTLAAWRTAALAELERDASSPGAPYLDLVRH